MVSTDKLTYETIQNQFIPNGTFSFSAHHLNEVETRRQLLNTSQIIQVPQFKFIVKGLVRLYPIPGAAGYAGALINSENSAMALIYGPLLHFDSDFTELLVIKHALLMFERSKLCGRAPIVIESDSRAAVSWIKSDIGNPWEVQLVVKEITMAMSRIRNADIRCNLGDKLHHRVVNELAMVGSGIKSAVELWH